MEHIFCVAHYFPSRKVEKTLFYNRIGGFLLSLICIWQPVFAASFVFKLSGIEENLSKTGKFVKSKKLRYKFFYFLTLDNLEKSCIFATQIFSNMKKDIHPDNYRLVVFKDMSNEDMFLCKSSAETKDTIEYEGAEYPLVKMEISSSSHPFYTGKVKLVDTAGRVDKFFNKYKNYKK